MAQEFEGASLSGINEAFGLSGVDAEQTTLLDDGNVSQVLDIGEPARRARAPAGASGLFHAKLVNVHVASGELLSFADPYAPAFPQNGYPSPIGAEFDIWLLGASVGIQAGSGAVVNWMTLGIDTRLEFQMFSDTAAGGAVAPANEEQVLAAWDEFTILNGTPENWGLTSAGVAYQAMRFRVPRTGGALLFRSEVSVASTATMILNLGIFPASLGQDVW